MAENASRHWLAKLLVAAAGAIGGAGIYGYMLYDFDFSMSVMLLVFAIFLIWLSVVVDGYFRKKI